MSSSVQLSILVVSTHVYQTSGYSKVSYGLLKELAKHPFLKVTHFGIQGLESLKGTRSYPESVAVYPVDIAVEQGFGFSQLATAIESVKPHIVFLYNDIGILKAYMDRIVPGSCKIWVYVRGRQVCEEDTSFGNAGQASAIGATNEHDGLARYI